MARFTTLAFAGSLALHGAAYASLGLAPRRSAEGRLPASVLFEVAEPEPPRAPEPPPKPVEPEPEEKTPAPRAAAPAAAPAPEPPPEAANAPAPVDLSGVTLTNGEGEGGWASPVGDGASRSGPVGPIGRAKPTATATLASAAPRSPLVPAAGQPALVAVKDLSERPSPPPLDGALRAHYPVEARQRAISGTASLRLRIDPDGRVRRASLLSESFEGFGAACKKALLGSRWSPPREKSGRAVATEVRYTCRFVVD